MTEPIGCKATNDGDQKNLDKVLSGWFQLTRQFFEFSFCPFSGSSTAVSQVILNGWFGPSNTLGRWADSKQWLSPQRHPGQQWKSNCQRV
ncbi:hypothetical protein [Ruegeria sp. HKCCD8929]|uniref:hypothetical protein n=1 Tax=Ruegeria sp. HKCCD8929 TaxID=2683006 RepID=UPI0014884D5E|nr:hypothetical protein [Ruegeria sp. HKCCD8929]